MSLSSDSFDCDSAPAKNQPFRILDVDLPSSPEIKTNITLRSKAVDTSSYSSSESEQNVEDQWTAVLFRKRDKLKQGTNKDLTKINDVNALPYRVTTRVRKLPFKFQDDDKAKKMLLRILKPTFLIKQDCDIDGDVLDENLKRLRSIINKRLKAKCSNSVTKLSNTENIDLSAIQDGKNDNSNDVRKKNRTTNKRESKRNVKVEESNPDVVNHLVTEVPEVSNERDGKNQTRELKRTRALSSKIKNENRRINTKNKKVKLKIPKRITRGKNYNLRSGFINSTKAQTQTEIVRSQHTKKESKNSLNKKQDKNKRKNINKSADNFHKQVKSNIKTENVELKPVRITRSRKNVSENLITTVESLTLTEKQSEKKAKRHYTVKQRKLNKPSFRHCLRSSKALFEKDIARRGILMVSIERLQLNQLGTKQVMVLERQRRIKTLRQAIRK